MLHIFMLVILLVICYYAMVSYGYISVLSITTRSLLTEPHQVALRELGVEAPIKQAIKEVIMWRRLVLLALAVGINWIVFWYIIGSLEDISYMYQTITCIATSGLIATMCMKDFTERWVEQLLLIGQWTSNRLKIHYLAKMILADSEEIMIRLFQPNPLSEDEQEIMMGKLREYDRHSTAIQEYNDVLKSAIKSLER